MVVKSICKSSEHMNYSIFTYSDKFQLYRKIKMTEMYIYVYDMYMFRIHLLIVFDLQ